MRNIVLCVVIVLGFVPLSGAHAAPLSVDNPGFEDPDCTLGCGASGTLSFALSAAGWTTEGNAVAGVFRPSLFAGTSGSYASLVPEGGQVGFVNFQSSLFQQLDDLLEPATLYTVGLDLGQRPDCCAVGAFRVQLLAGGAVLAEIGDLGLLPAAGTFARVSFGFSTAAGDQRIGDPLAIRISNLDPASVNSQLNFDAITVDASVVPLPAPAGLLATAWLMLVARRRRRGV
jgi:hypothetical protein